MSQPQMLPPRVQYKNAAVSTVPSAAPIASGEILELMAAAAPAQLEHAAKTNTLLAERTLVGIYI